MPTRLRGAVEVLIGGVAFMVIAYWASHPHASPISYDPRGFGGVILMGIPGMVALVGLVELTTGRPMGDLEETWAALAWWKQAVLGLMAVVVGGALAIAATALVLGNIRGEKQSRALPAPRTIAQSAEAVERRPAPPRAPSPWIEELTQAVSRNDAGMVKEVLARGADINASNRIGWTPLYIATINSHESMVTLLLDAGADVNGRAVLSGTPLDYGRIKLPIAQLLLGRGAKVNVADDLGSTPLHRAVDGGNPDVVTLYLAQGASANARTHDGVTPLHLAARGGNRAVVDLLLSAGADANARDKEQRTPLFLAVHEGHVDVLEALVKEGASVDAANDGGITPLMRAIYDRRPELVEWLLAQGADVKLRSRKGETALHPATSYGTLQLVRQLLARGADVNAHTDSGGTALDIAEHHRKDDVAQLLRSSGAHVEKFRCSRTVNGATTGMLRRGGCPPGYTQERLSG